MIADIEILRYPIGRYKKPETYTTQQINNWIEDIAQLPKKMRKATEDLSDEQLDTPYRPEGWTIRQVVHHCSDSHLNAMARIKWALTEDTPIIKPYHEEKWAELADTKQMPIEAALTMLEGIHARWVYLLRSLNADELKRAYFHSGENREFTIAEVAALYAWHSNHHLAHITTLKERMNWN